tara:strand:+ start:177 stop:422 length:246 start_codon:yes stop_codon:yes gene_type:complete
MFTIETEFDKCVVTTIDEKGLLDDVVLEVLQDGSVNVLQYNNYYEAYAIIHMSRNQWYDLLSSMDNTDGAYYSNELGDEIL